jgi:hypothetical protein
VATRAKRATPTAVYLEVGRRRVFACALDWPGWCRSGKDERLALDALATAAPHYAAVAKEAGQTFPPDLASAFDVVERLPGSATTDFGAPGEVATSDAQPLTRREAERMAKLVAATWPIFDRVVAGAPADLRKGPRGGGRDRDAIVAHVLDAETAYARKLGLRLRPPAIDDVAAISGLREAIVGVLRAASSGSSGEPLVEKGWPPRYAARRIAWHVLDHAWEIEDRSTP